MAEIERRVPPRIVFPVAGNAHALRPLPERLELHESTLHLGFDTDDSDEILHRRLQSLLHLIRALCRGAARERLERRPRLLLDHSLIHRWPRVGAGEFPPTPPGALAGPPQSRHP